MYVFIKLRDKKKEKKEKGEKKYEGIITTLLFKILITYLFKSAYSISNL